MQPVTFSQIGLFVACLIVALGIALAVKLLFSRTPPMHREYVSRDEYRQRQDKLDQELARHAARRAEIYALQTEHGLKLAVLESETKVQTKTLDRLESQGEGIAQRVDELPKRMVDMLLAARELGEKKK